MDKEIIIAKNTLVTLDKKTSEEKLRLDLYSIMTTVLLSKNIFNKNVDISNFLNSCNIIYKEYVYRSRTIIVSRTIRIIESSDKERLLVFVNELKSLLFQNENNIKKTKKQKTKNIADDILKQFGREL